MRITKKSQFSFFLLSLISLAIWFKLSYPQLAFVNLSIDRKQAVQVAKDYLKEINVDSSAFSNAAIFGVKNSTNQYLQKNLGFVKMKEFIKEHNIDMFYWSVRFFKEGEKEAYKFAISSASGEIISFSHSIDNMEKREIIPKEEAKKKAIDFLISVYDFDPDKYEIKGDLQYKLDNRTDYAFSWEKTSVSIPWSDEKDAGTGKLLIGAVISGDEVLSFSNNVFDAPEKYGRDLAKRGITGKNILTVVQLLYYILFIGSIYFLAAKHNHLSMHTTKRFYIWVMLISFSLSLIANLNQFQTILIQYNTTSPFDSYLFRLIVNTVLSSLFLTAAILMPSLSGECLHFEYLNKKPAGSFLYYIRTTFFSREVFDLIILGYFICIIMLGLQALLFKIGQTYWGVWTEFGWMTQLTTAYLPFIAAFSIGYKASISEELMYRLFAISWGKKLFKSTVVAAIISSFIWGFAHSGYPVYPMWFRGVEVTCIGFFLAFVYLRYGIIPVIIGHYLFDVFWNTAEYLFGSVKPFYFFSSLSVLLLPLAFGLIAYFVNKLPELKEMKWRLTKHQEFNLNVLRSFLEKNKNMFGKKTKEEIKKEIASHGWDMGVVEVALDEESIEK
ncbi:MAG: CPBP family intramembrane metalloprotease [Candidatus Omnitrophica bacterium]|nr:CPBP family intramembrane metalloprotease [Candidatus Omnitrophota bacterium]MBU1995693.1 CPBP family intramembrane metalloprotease [Candidatus Omnitrophota bacterium]MBU4334831.1 CPBP family intramembrane metalloprotease [Candidatus Omnitrophota bacterium]